MSIDVVAAVTAGFKLVVPKLLKQCGYIVFCNSHASDLRREIRNLKNASDRLQHKVDLAGSVGDIIEGDVWTWLTDAEELIKSKNEILEKNNVVSCCFGIVPNPYARYVLGRGAQNSLTELKDLIEKGKIEQVSYHPAAEQDSEVKVRSATGSSSTVRYVELKSRALVVKRIIAELNDHDKIGVHGMGGVGKTTLLKDVEKRARDSGKFDDVVNVFVSQAPNIEGIKSKIRNKLGSLGSNEANKKTLLILLDDIWSKLEEIKDLEKDSNVKVKWVMTSRKQELLDKGMECYPTISLDVLEVEEGWDLFGELVNNSEVEELKSNPAVVALLTKCGGLPVSIGALAKILEKKGLSSIDLVNADVLKLGKESINGSASLELSYKYLGDSGVANLGRSLFCIIGLLGTPTVPILTLLKYTIGLGLLGDRSDVDGIMERARKQVTVSLRMLQDASLLLESDDSDYVKIHDVVRDVAANIASRDDRALIINSGDGMNGWSNDDILKLNDEEVGAAQGLGLLSSNNNIMERATRHVITLRMLQDASLLLGSDHSDYVKIHDIVRNVAASITSRDDHALVFDNNDNGLIRGWSKEKLKNSRSVYFPYSVIPMLKERWECPELSIFIMEGDHILSRQKEGRGQVEVPSSFYQGMVKLKVLDLRNAWLSSFPSSIQSDLCNLTTLFLHFCCIENVSVIGKLESLQILSFVGSDLAHLPKEIGDLAKLRILDLSKCSELKTIEPGTLKRLTRLEELYIKESFDGWEVEGVDQPSNSSLVELNCLPRLRTLEVCVPDTNTLPLKLPLGDLARYKVLIGDSWDWSGEYRESRTLKFKDNSKNILNEDWLQSALQTTQDLYIDGLIGAGGSFHEQCKERFKELKYLHIQNSTSIQYIIWSTEWLDCIAFTILESMILEKIDSLEKICHGLINSISFSKLKVVRIKECHKLLNLFNLSLVNSLTDLEEIEVSNCNVVREIVTAEEMDDNDGTDNEDHKEGMKGCPNSLFGCPIRRSKGMAKAPYVINLGNLRCLTLRNLPKLRTFFGNEALSEPTEITGNVLLNDQKGALEGCKRKKLLPASRYKEIPRNTHLELDKLQRLELLDCKNIVHFLSSSMLLKLVHLESLTIAACESLEDIFDLNGVVSKSRDIEVLPMLSELKLRELPKLEHIWKKNNMQIKGCQSLRTIEIYECSSLLYVSSSSMCEGMKNLTEINVRHCNKMKTVFLEGLAKSASSVDITAGLRSLKTLVISHCPNLKAFLSDNYQAGNKDMPYWCCGKQANDVPADTCSFFNQKVFLPDLEGLIISGAGEFDKLCSEAPAKSYCNLEFVHIEYCQNLLTVFSAALVERLQKLKHLLVKGCNKLETVINLAVDWQTKKKPKYLMLPQLQNLKMESLDSLRRIIEKDSDYEIVVGFPNLRRVEVLHCKELTHLIPAATATTLLKLEQLEIDKCAKLKELVYGEVSERNKRKDDVISFPRLTSLIIYGLHSLTCFCSESYSFDFTCLKDLRIWSCNNLKILVKQRSYGNSGSQDADGANTATQGFFSEKDRLPNLETISLSYCKFIEELWGEEPLPGSFCKLKDLTIYSCPGLRTIFPSFMANRLQGFESMDLGDCGSVEDIFNITSTQLILSSVDDDSRNNDALKRPCIVEGSTERTIALTKLTVLRLMNIKLCNLQCRSYILELPSLRKLDISFTATEILEKVHLPNLEELKFTYAGGITEMWHSEPHMGSFCKLKELQVVNCNKLKKVIPWFMLKRLQNLEKLVVEDCESLETVCELGGSLDKQVGDIADSEIPFLSPFRNLISVSVNKCKSLRNLFSLLGQHHEDRKATLDHDSANDRIVVLPELNKLRLEDLPNFRHLYHDVLELQYTLELPALKEFFLIESGAKEAVTQKVVFSEEVEIREEDVTFFGSATNVLKEITNALQISHQNNHRIIGLLGCLDGILLMELERQLKDEADLCDEIVWSGGDAETIQEGLRTGLGIIYRVTDEQGRAQILQNSLLSNRQKRLLLLMFVDEDEDEAILDIEALGIPRHRLDPMLFKQVVVSEDREVLVKMGVQRVIDVGYRIGERWQIFEQELSECDSKELQVGTYTKGISLFGDPESSSSCELKTTSYAKHSITWAVETHPNDQIIGILGSYNERLFVALGFYFRQSTELFDEVVNVYGKSTAENIQERLGSRLGITYGKRGIAERAQYLRETLLSNKDKKMLLIIASALVEDHVNLESVGIPQLDPKLFKIILVSEKREVLDQMGAQLVVDDIGDISHLWWYHKLADESGCDPLAKLLAKKLMKKSLPAWENALQRLQDSPLEFEARKKVIDSL